MTAPFYDTMVAKQRQAQSGSSIRNEARFRALVVGVAVVASAGLFYLRFGGPPELPDVPPGAAGDLERSDEEGERLEPAYRARVGRDAERFEATTEPDEMARAFPHRADEPGAALDPRGELRSIRAAGLRLRVEVEPVEGSHRHQTVLAIESLLDRHAAYRVVTRPSSGRRDCQHRRALPHDAITIAPGAAMRRSECIYRSGQTLEILRVETLELPELGYYYASRLRPRDIALPKRTSGAHRPAVGAPCDLVLSAPVTRALESGDLRWRDAIDFYARHDCGRFMIPRNYRAFEEDGERRLPVASPLR